MCLSISNHVGIYEFLSLCLSVWSLSVALLIHKTKSHASIYFITYAEPTQEDII